MEIPEILECIMMICFGFSWPISVAKNIRAKTAKSMSLPFILLILFGYLAGVVSKFLSHNIGFVLIVYFLNIASVCTNLVVYFINLGFDRRAKKQTENQTALPAVD